MKHTLLSLTAACHRGRRPARIGLKGHQGCRPTGTGFF